jgi:hypothetical protein
MLMVINHLTKDYRRGCWTSLAPSTVLIYAWFSMVYQLWQARNDVREEQRIEDPIVNRVLRLTEEQQNLKEPTKAASSQRALALALRGLGKSKCRFCLFC